MTLPLPSEDSLNSKFELPAPPDLLRRFVPLPYRGTWLIDSVMFEVETNRKELLRRFRLDAARNAETAIRLKVVVDPEMEAANEGVCLILDSGQMCWGNVYGTRFGFDRASGELFIFVPEALIHEFKPILEELLHQTEPILADATQL